MGENADARTDTRKVAVDRHERTKLADVEGALVARLHEKSAGAMEIVPLRFIASVAVEDLNTMVLAIGDIDPALAVAADVVDDIEAAGIRAGLRPMRTTVGHRAHICERAR